MPKTKTTPADQTARRPNPIDVEAGRRVRERREAGGYNQSDLGRALGLTFQQIQKYEKGTNRISVSKLVAMAQFLNCHPADLIPCEADITIGDGPPPVMTRFGSLNGGRRLAEAFLALEPASRSALTVVAEAMAKDRSVA